MSYEIYRYIFIGGAVLAGVMLATAVLLFIILHIPRVVGYLTGTNERKAIEQIRMQNESTEGEYYKTSFSDRQDVALTDKISDLESPLRTPMENNSGEMVTTELTSSEGTEILEPWRRQGGETMPLGQMQENVFGIEFEITYIHSDEIVV